MIVLQGIVIALFLALCVRGFLHRKMPRVGGKIGAVRAIDPPPTLPAGISRVHTRAVTLFVASDAGPFPSLKAFLRDGTAPKSADINVYRVSGSKTEIEIPNALPDYERIDAAHALSLLRELPDARRVRRLHLSDDRSYLDPWVRKVVGDEFFFLGHATNMSLIVLYKPDRRLGEFLGGVLLHEWLHLVAFASAIQIWRFRHANAVEPLPPTEVDPIDLGTGNTVVHEAWCDLGEKLFGYDDGKARQAALASPVHAIIVWRCVERILRATPPRFRSTRFDELMQRARFMQTEVAPIARAIRANRFFKRKIFG